MEGLEREAGAVVGVERLKANCLRGLVDLIDPGLLRQRILEGLRVVGAGQGPEEWNVDADRPVAGRLDVDQMNRQRVARLGALDVEGTRLRVEVGKLADLAEDVTRRADMSGKAVLV